MLEALSQVLSAILDPIYALCGNWWVAIALFTLATKVLLMPLSLWVQANYLRMVSIMPEVNRIKVAHFGDAEAIGELQSALFKERHYHPMLSLIPLAVQILILFGLIDVIHSITGSGAPGTELLGRVPIEGGGLAWIMPVAAGLSALTLGIAQNHINPLQREQSRAEQWSTNGLSIALALVLGVFVAAGMAFYWVCSNLLAIVVQLACNLIMDPKRRIDYDDLRQSQAQLAEIEGLSGSKDTWWRPSPLARREKADYKRFFQVIGKHIVFYSEGSGFYKYFRGAIEYLLSHSDVIIHYVTNDPDDQIFAIAEDEPRVFPYYVSEKRAITLFMKMDADVVVMTQMDLDNYYMRRSYVRDDVEYVYMLHHPTSLTLVSNEGAFDHYDTILCVGPHQVREMRAMEEKRGLDPQRLVECGYDLIDREIADYEARPKEANERPTILIAPSWQEDNLLDSCIDDLVQPLLGKGYRIVVRPHPEYTKRYRARWEALMARYASVDGSELSFEDNLGSNESILSSDILVTDWSSVAMEFSFSTLKPCVFVDTPMKESNPSWRSYGVEPTDLTLRDELGVSIAPKRLREDFAPLIEDMLAHKEAWAERIEAIRDSFFFNLGHGGDAAGEYLIEAIMARQAERASA